MEAVERLVDAAVGRVLLGDARVTSAAEGVRQLSGQTGSEELADKVQRVVVLATPIVRVVARGAKFTRLPWVMIASMLFNRARARWLMRGTRPFSKFWRV